MRNILYAISFVIEEREGEPKDISNDAVVEVSETYDYTGKPIRPYVSVKMPGVYYGYYSLTRGTDYDVTYTNNVEVGTATVTITGVNDYTGTKTATFQIVDPDANLVSISDATVTVPAVTYTGSALTPAPTVKLGDKTLTKGTDYKVSYTNNTKAGKGTVTITGVGSGGYKGTKTATFVINRAKVAVPKAKTGLTYTGKAQVGVASGTGYALTGTYQATNAGTYKATATPDANHAWTDGSTAPKAVSWSIARAKVAAPKAKTGLVYSGTVQAGVAGGTGYALSGTYQATNAGTYKATATPGANYAWSDGTTSAKTLTWSIARAKVAAPKAKTGLVYSGTVQAGVAGGTGYALSGTYKATNAGTYKATATPDANHAWADGSTAARAIPWTIARAKVAVPKAKTGLTYTGKAQVGVASGTGYALTGTAKAANAGTYKATATPDANHAWTDGSTAAKAVSWKIAAKAVTPTVTLSKTSFVYNGKVQKPTVTVKVGSATLATSGYTVTYASGLKDVGAYKVTVKLKGNYSGSKAVSYTIVPKGTTISALSPASKALTATWAKQATQTTGYQVQYATASSFASAKTVTVGSPGATSKKIGSLAGKKRYYVRIRTYRKVGTAIYYSAWSAAKSAVTKA